MTLHSKENNIYLYWIGNEYKLIKILRNLIYLHSTNGKGYNVNLITPKNIHEYIKDLPEYFYKLCYAHQADYVRICVICDNGGIWLDSDVIILDSLDYLFDLINNKNGFFIKENNSNICNGIFGSKPNTLLMKEIKNILISRLEKDINIYWTEIGNALLTNLYNNKRELYNDYEFFDGLDNLYPINWNHCVNEFIIKPYDNYKNIVREFQPLIVLVNSVYKNLEDKTEKEILTGKMPLNYFINKSFENMKHLIDLDFIEIGTSNFNTLIQNSNNEYGISVDGVDYYLKDLPDKPNVKKINVLISNINSFMEIYYIPENIIIEKNLESWFKGCNSINNYHPLHIKHNLQHLVIKEKVKVITTYELFYYNKVKKVNFLKIDAEGHDYIILESLFEYLKNLPIIFYPNKILFESNENSNIHDIDDIIDKYISIGYKLSSRGYDSIIELI